MWVDVETVDLSMESEKSGQVEMRDFGPMMRSSDLLQLSLRKFVCIQEFISVRQFVRVDWEAAVMDVVEM